MSTDNPNNPTTTTPPSNPQPEATNPISDIVNTMQSVNTTTPKAIQNVTSMSDNNGDRITFNEDPPKSDTSDK